MNKSQVLIINSAMEVATVDDKIIIFEPTGEKIYVLEEEEKEILCLFDGKNSIGDIETKLSIAYDGEENLLQDFEEYVIALKEKGVLIEKEQ